MWFRTRIARMTAKERRGKEPANDANGRESDFYIRSPERTEDNGLLTTDDFDRRGEPLGGSTGKTGKDPHKH